MAQTDTDTRIALSTETRDLVRSKKRGGEPYDDLLKKMVDQYDPEAGAVGSYRVGVRAFAGEDESGGEDHSVGVLAASEEQARRVAADRLLGRDGVHHVRVVGVAADD